MENSSNILKLSGYGVYVTSIDGNLFICEMVPRSGGPTLDPDNCIEWSPLEEPSNQKFLNLCNAKFETCFTMSDFGGYMSLGDIKGHVRTQEMSEAELRYMVKNMREKEK
jgi:hypothetical protein